MPHKMEVFNHMDSKDVNTDSIPPFVLGNNDGYGKTYYSDSLTLGPEYREDESISKEIRHLMKLEREAKRHKGEVTWLWRGWLLYLPAVLSLFSLILFLLIVMGVALLRGCIVMVLIEPWVWVEHCGSLVGIVVGRRCSDLLGGNRCVTKIVLLEFKSVPLTSRFVDRCHDEELFGEVLETSPLLSERDSLEVDWHIRISLQEFVILPVKELSRKKRVVRSSLVVMDPAGRRSSQLLA
ncbi:hypothetical protein Tco_0557927 [Tanacetum coccineum]